MRDSVCLDKWPLAKCSWGSALQPYFPLGGMGHTQYFANITSKHVSAQDAGTYRKPSVPTWHTLGRSTMWFARQRVLTYCCCLICWWYPLCGFSVKSPWLYYRLVRLKHNPSLLLQGILNKANPDRATVTTDPAGVGKACKASGSVPARAYYSWSIILLVL